jgi:hypothetical protein
MTALMETSFDGESDVSMMCRHPSLFECSLYIYGLVYREGCVYIATPSCKVHTVYIWRTLQGDQLSLVVSHGVSMVLYTNFCL